MTNNQTMELRGDIEKRIFDVLVSYAEFHGMTRNQVLVHVLRPWAEEKIREANAILKAVEG